MVRKTRKKPSFQRQKLGFVYLAILFPIHETYFHLVLSFPIRRAVHCLSLTTNH
jgi:hypothetical protein